MCQEVKKMTKKVTL